MKPAKLELIYEVIHSGERAAGIHPYTDTITVTIDSGDPGGDKGEFEAQLKEFLREWFDGAKVLTQVEMAELIKAENTLWNGAK